MLGTTTCKKACLHINAKPTDQTLHIMIQAKFICLLHVIYDIHSEESEDTKIICILSDYHIRKGNMIQEGFMTFYWVRKKIIVDFYISCNATVRNKYVFRYVSDISRISIQCWTTY